MRIFLQTGKSIELILFPEAKYPSRTSFDRSLDGSAITLIFYQLLPTLPKKMMPEPREGATFGTKFFSDICSARQASIETSWHSLKFQKSFLVNQSNAQPCSTVTSWPIVVIFREDFSCLFFIICASPNLKPVLLPPWRSTREICTGNYLHMNISFEVKNR